MLVAVLRDGAAIERAMSAAHQRRKPEVDAEALRVELARRIAALTPRAEPAVLMAEVPPRRAIFPRIRST
jgi:hypothetical protein